MATLTASDLRAVHEILSHEVGLTGSPRTLIAYLMDLLYYADFRIVEQAAAFSDVDHTNLVAVRAGSDTASRHGGLLLCASIPQQTPVDDFLWTSTEEDPFCPQEHDGLLFGYGAAGARVDLMCKIIAAARVQDEELKRPLIVAGLFGPEARVGGAMYLLDSGLCYPQWALVGEGTDLQLVNAHRGQLNLRFALELLGDRPARTGTSGGAANRRFRIQVSGAAAHSANPSLGRNALNLALETIRRFRLTGHGFSVHNLRADTYSDVIPAACSFELETREPDWVPAAPGLHVRALPADDSGDVRTEPSRSLDGALGVWDELVTRLHELFRWTAPDTAPDFMPSTPIYSLVGASVSADALILDLDYRTLPGQRVEQLVRDVEALSRRISGPGRRIQVSVERNLLPMDGPDTSELIEAASDCLRQVGIPPVITPWAGNAEGWIFAAAGVETLLFGPGNSLGQAYRPNEHVPLIHLERTVAFYERMIRQLCC